MCERRDSLAVALYMRTFSLQMIKSSGSSLSNQILSGSLVWGAIIFSVCSVCLECSVCLLSPGIKGIKLYKRVRWAQLHVQVRVDQLSKPRLSLLHLCLRATSLPTAYPEIALGPKYTALFAVYCPCSVANQSALESLQRHHPSPAIAIMALDNYYRNKIEGMKLEIIQGQAVLRRLEAQRNDYNSRVRLLREELGLLQQPGSYVGEVVKVMSTKKILVKVHPEGKYGRSHLLSLAFRWI